MTENNYDETEKVKIEFNELTSALLNNDVAFSPKYLSRFSDLEGDEFEKLLATWPKIESSRRISLLEDLEEMAESNSLMFFENVFVFAMEDENSIIRQIAIRALWESDDKTLISKLLNILENDQEEVVQGQAATGLGHFIYLGELGKLTPDTLEKIVNSLIEIINSKYDRRIQMRALESLGNSGDERISELIEDKYDFGDEDWIASAIIAMGRSADEQWQPHILEKLDHANVQIRLEATKAAGLLEITNAEMSLISLTNDEDDEIRMAAAWSLSEIGGDESLKALERMLEESEDEDESDLIQSAIENLTYNEELGDFSLFDISPDDPEQQGNQPPVEE